MSSFRRRQAHYTLLRLFVSPLMRDDANWNNITSIGSPHAPDREHSETFLSVQSCQRKSLSCNFSCIAHSCFNILQPAFDNILKGKFINCTNNFLFETTITSRMLVFREKRAWMRAGYTRVFSVLLLGGKLTASKLHFAVVAVHMYHYVLSNPFLGSFVEQNAVTLTGTRFVFPCRYKGSHLKWTLVSYVMIRF